MRISCFLFGLFVIFMLSCYSENADGTEYIEPFIRWTTNKPLLRRETNVAVFTSGFFCLDNCTTYFYAIFISPITKLPQQAQQVWWAKSEYPTRKNAVLHFTSSGDVVLKDVDGSILWATNTTGKAVAGFNLTDTGNLVLLDDHKSVVWQSFDNPIDILLPGQELFQGQTLTSYYYYLQLIDKGVFVYSSSTTYYGWLVYGKYTNKGRRYMSFLNGSLSFFIESSEQSDPVGVISIPEASSTQYMQLTPEGNLNVFEWQLDEWKVIKDLTPVLKSHSHTAELSTTWDANYSYAKPMLLRETYGGLFACGFLCEGNCTYDNKSSHYIFAILISPTTVSPKQRSEVVWSANKDHPVRENAILNFTAAGELMLKDGDGSIVWTTNTTGKSVAGMNLTDTGNLVLFDDQNSIVWQSFDYPSDSLLLGQKLFSGQKLKSEGMYFAQVTDKGLVAYVESNPPQAYYNMFVNPYGNDKHKGNRYIKFLNGSLSFFPDSSEQSGPFGVISIPEASSAQYLKLMPDGHLKVFEWQSDSYEWSVVTDLTTFYVKECDYPLVCGRNSICSTNQQCSCPGTEYFKAVNDRQPNLGCFEITPLSCNSTNDQEFITLENVTYFTYASSNMVRVNIETCKQACLHNCSCKAAFFNYDDYSNDVAGECLLASEIFTMSSISYNMNASAFIKVQNATTHHVSHQVAKIVGSTIGSFMLLLVVAIGFITYVVHKRKWDVEMEEEYLDQVPGMPTRFSYEELRIATENFSKKLGEGGFGSVFEGSLKDESKIAVKCLEGLSHIKKSFLAEVQSIGSIHHVNLVRLRGFCTWKSQRFLVYDFMSNGSLDKWIYNGVREHILEWECIKKIILDIAKGLAYLHEDCRQKIVHLDIKPQNILLDNDFNAKVSDFGLSKLIDKSQTEVMTPIKGTPGYIAPEWRSSIITEKVDVYSFGIVLLEILCGRKIFDRSLAEESWYLLSAFQNCWEQGTLLDMVDEHSEDMQVHKTEVMEMMKVAAWCLQTNYKRRPSMSSVVKVLEGGMNVEPNLDYNFTDLRIQEPTVGGKSDFTLLSSSLLSGPR